ncbi:YqhR family membrane protein [Oceanobacillus chungangensis]|uniref:Uncharacterized protein n=1 Tax=Oceanobacillus chungangensis TaxID=1229152 RepID=A0A3D8Q2Q9_9BACI|nr:YqhR family membrane protein [Oceanobacillus chungangensis]RDW21951.1 hypothetical protein CWR45_00225 [Oceanobacillus chungangensis]
MVENKHVEKNQQKESLLPSTILTGFVGGLFWSLVGVIISYFNFTELSPRTFILRPWLRLEWTEGWLGNVLSIGIIGLLSIIVALIYFVLCKKIYSMWMGVIFGIILWGIVFYLLQPVFTNVPRLTELTPNTILSTISLFILYGTFIGYTISYNYHDSERQLHH